MAVTITIAELRAALRLTDSAEETAEITRLLAFVATAVIKHVPIAPDVVHNEAVRRLAGYYYDMPEAGRGEGYANAIRNSGVGRMLLPYRVHRAGTTAVEVAQEAVGSAGNPVVGVDVVGSSLIVTFADGAIETETLPAGGEIGMTGVSSWALLNNTDAIPLAKLGNVPTRYTDADATSIVETLTSEWALASSSALIPSRKVTNATDGQFLAIEGTSIIGKGLGDIQDATARSAAATAQAAVDALTDRVIVEIRIPADGSVIVEERANTDDNTSVAIPNTLRPVAWAQIGNADQVPFNKLGEVQQQAATWARIGNTEQIPNPKINFDVVQNQIDAITSELTHTGTKQLVVGSVGSSMTTLRYTLPSNLDGVYDLSVRVTASVQVNDFVNFTGNVRITEEGGGGLAIVVPEKHHNYGHAHEAVLTFVRKRVAISPGASVLDFTTEVTGNNPPDIYITDAMNMTITDTELVNRTNVGQFVSDWAETGNVDLIPTEKLPPSDGAAPVLEYVTLSITALASNRYTLAPSHALAVANVLIDGGYNALIITFEDFNRHQNNWRIPIGLENYAQGVSHEFYWAYSNNSTGNVHGVNLDIERTTPTAATVSLGVINTGAFDAGTTLYIRGERFAT